MEAGRGRPIPKQKSYPGRAGRGRGDDDEDPHDRGDRRDHARDREEHRRRQPRSRSQRVAARSAASSGARATGVRGGTPAVTRETRRLEPRSARAPPMTVANATCFWLHTMGLRDGADVDDRRALDPAGHGDRVRALQEVRPEDVVVVMTGLLRTMAMVMVELSQLMMIRVQPLLPADDNEEVEVELDDEEVWMQTSLISKKRSRDEVEIETLAADQHEYRTEVAQDNEARAAQQEERAQEEDEQAQQDECLYEQHRAAQYRDWEWWVVANYPPPVPRRLRAVLTVSHGSGSEAVSCSVPLARGHPVELRINLAEQAGEPLLTPEQMEEHRRLDMQPAPVQSPATGSQDPPNSLPQDAQCQSRYVAWRDGQLSNHQVAAELGEDMVALFWAQWLVETEEIVTEEAGIPDQEGLRGPGFQEQCSHPASPCSASLSMPVSNEDGGVRDQEDVSVVVAQEVQAEGGRSRNIQGSMSPAGFMGDV